MALGLAAAAAGPAQAVSGQSREANASQAQYAEPGGGGELGEEQAGGDDGDEGSAGGGAGGGGGGQAGQQAAGGGGLPFTGYLAIPLILAGVGLLVAGLILRRPPWRRRHA